MGSREEWQGGETPLDRRLDDLLQHAMQVEAPEGLVEKTMERLAKTRTATVPLWAWAVYAGFFAAALFGLAYWNGAELILFSERAALELAKDVALATQYPRLLWTVAGAFLVNALVLWFVAAEWLLHKRFQGVTPS